MRKRSEGNGSGVGGSPAQGGETDFFTKRRDAFHAHLDDCRQCREHPLELCGTGHVLLMAAALGLAAPESKPDTEGGR